MTDYAFLGQLTTITAACIAIAVTIVKRAREWYAPQITIEAEDVACRGVVKANVQHYPPLTLADDEPVDDPVWSLVDRLETDRVVNGM